MSSNLNFCKAVIPLLFAAVAAYATTPRPLAQVPIPTPNGKNIDLKQYRGKVVVVALISTHCEDCIKSIAILNRAQKDFGSQGFQAIGVAGDENAQYLIGPFIKAQRPIFPMGYLGVDGLKKLADMAPDRRPVAPIFLFIDKKGIVRFQYYGDEPFFKTEENSTRSLIKSLLR